MWNEVPAGDRPRVEARIAGIALRFGLFGVAIESRPRGRGDGLVGNGAAARRCVVRQRDREIRTANRAVPIEIEGGVAYTPAGEDLGDARDCDSGSKQRGRLLGRGSPGSDVVAGGRSGRAIHAAWRWRRDRAGLRSSGGRRVAIPIENRSARRRRGWSLLTGRM